MAPIGFLALWPPKAQKRVPGRNFELFLAIEIKINPQRSVFMLFQAIKKTKFLAKTLKGPLNLKFTEGSPLWIFLTMFDISKKK